MESMTYTCIVCPVSCRVTVGERPDGDLDITGHTCKRGLAFAKGEHTAPTRMLTTTVRLLGAHLRRLPVISSGEIPKGELLTALQELYSIEVTAPVHMGDVVLPNIRGTGVDIVAARSVP